jgi:hypothetical protein
VGKDWVEQIKSGKKELSIDYLKEATHKGDEIVKSLSGKIARHSATMTYKGAKNEGLVPPIQPLMVLLEGENINFEDFSRDWIVVFSGTGGFRLGALKLFEKFYYSEASQVHGTMLQKATYQRNQAKELLQSIQNLKTAIINIESDLEKMDEQLKAFKGGDWDQIKGLFIDNYGGPQRSWTAIARNVPLVRMAMTWFLRLKVKKSSEEEMPIKKFSSLKITEGTETEKLKQVSRDIETVKAKLDEGAKKNKKLMLEEIEKLVKDEQVNPAIANYLKRKVEEFWNWVIDYVGWLTRTRNGIMSNLIQQKANLKLYMKWTADHITQAERMEMKPDDVVGAFPEFNFKGSPKEILAADYVFYSDEENRPDVYELCRPWVPVVMTSIVIATTIELQKKFMEMGFVSYYGYMHDDDLKELIELAKSGGKDLVRTMLDSGAVTEAELSKVFTAEEIKEMQGGAGKPKHNFNDNLQLFLSTLRNNLDGFAGLFGLGLPKESLPWTRERRAASMAADLTMEGIRNFKKSKKMLIME